jgi:arylsulfatase A-like enzyme
VILILTDDQGYGDLGAHGNTMIRTPNMNRLWGESIRLTNFHVDPTCAPTRSAIMSGRYSNRCGVWHTIMGRSLMNPGETTLAEVFRANGYRTGMFGKWHLGDNAPLRPEDQGFDEVLRHGGGGVGQGPDWWGNDYNDDTYWRNGKPEPCQGYCTDVWFREAIAFVERNRERPFFCYLSTNAPHGPLIVDPKYAKPYLDQGVPGAMAKFYGMIENIDENLGKLREQLARLGLAENTLLLFLTDNGTANGVARKAAGQWSGFNAGMRGQKGSVYEGGHRVPLFVHWPARGWTKGRDADQLCAHIDLQPTLIDLCGLTRPAGPALDGTSLRPVLEGDAECLRNRTLFVHSQRIAHPQKWRNTAVMTDRWRLVNRTQLYDIHADPGQRRNIHRQHPAVAARLAAAYDAWWESLKPTFDQYVRIHLGDPAENPARLMSHDCLAPDIRRSPWSQGHVQRGTLGGGPWAVQIVREGRYRFELYRWPRHLAKPAGCTHAELSIANRQLRRDLKPDDVCARFETDLRPGPAMLQGWLTRQDGKRHTPYFLWVTFLA